MSTIISSLIPASRLAAVETALQQAFDTTTVTDISLLAGGLSASSVYKMIVRGQPYVLKLDAPSPGNAALPSANLQQAADAGIAPPLYYQDAANGIAISGFIDNKPVRAVFTPDRLTRELAGAIRAIHAIPCHSGGNDLRETIDTMISGFRQSRMLSGPILDECFSHYEMIRRQYPWDDPGKVFSHNDLNPNNILCDGERIWIIDWDAAFPNDRYVDLASAANFFVHTEEQEKIFLGTYFNGAANDHNTARFHVMRQVCRIIYAMLMFRLAAQGKQQHNQEMEGITLKTFGALMGAGKISLAAYEGQLMYGKALLNEAVHQMRAPRFTAALALLG